MLSVKQYSYDAMHLSGEELKAAVTISTENSLLPLSEEEILNYLESVDYISFDGAGIDLEDYSKTFYSGGYAGYFSSTLSDANKRFSDDVFTLTLHDTIDLVYPKGLTFSFYGYCCSCLGVTFTFTSETIGTNQYTKEIPVIGDEVYINLTLTAEDFADDEVGTYVFANSIVSEIKIYAVSAPLANQAFKLKSIVNGKIKTLTKFRESELLEEISILSDDLAINSFKCEAVITEEEAKQLKENDPINIYSNNRYYGTMYIDKTEKTAPNIYSLKAYNSVNGLENIDCFDSKNGSEMFDDNQLDVLAPQFKLEDALKRIAYISDTVIQTQEDIGNYIMAGCMPINTCRYNLCSLCFASCFMVYAARSAKIKLIPIPTQITSVITTASKRIIGEWTYKKNKVITEASYTYTAGVLVGKEGGYVEICNTPNEEFRYYFENPTSVTDAVESQIGLTVNFATSNYADIVVNDSTGEGTLWMSPYDITRQTVKIIGTESKTQSKKVTFDKLDLRGNILKEGAANWDLVNMDSLVSKKILDIEKYIKSGGTVKGKIRLRGERVGDLIQIETAYDGIKTGIITSMDISFGYEDVAEIEVLEWSL